MNNFKNETDFRIEEISKNIDLQNSGQKFMELSISAKYSYNFSWMGRPIIQYPQDIVAVQELIWKIKPDLIIETGIAHGGSLILSASMLALLDVCDAAKKKGTLTPGNSARKVVGIDIDIRPHNKEAIEDHPLAAYIEMLEGSSIDPEMVKKVCSIAENHQKILVFLDSNHTHEHVLAELKAYAPLVSTDSYCVVFDTIVEDLPKGGFSDRPWGPGDNPKTAVWEYIKSNPNFEIDTTLENKLLLTVAPDGYLKRRD
ncbi:cephalosporin hydroxylase family protein [Thalassospira xiamenensis]|uniref:Cephalosporin hydroxylase n=1 Tax=Thalassospira xiamenensis TaxID=220697 RepID=A0A285T6Q8_9PROT|nr:cephalosporin hydroxylase family protein [Thalassospira xiamenensis]SOC16724.1 Cephalosporin hydroxylase [Thalassospira xiamenensis]